MLDLNLNGKTALVCGSSQGLGEACAVELAALECRVILLARNQAKLSQVMQTLPNQHLQHDYISLDISDLKALEKVILEKLQNSNIDILVNNAGGPKAGPLLDVELAGLNEAFKQHVLASHLLATLVVPGMKRGGYGRIINILSTSVKEPLPNLGTSNTIRWAMASWAKSLANEVGQFGITVNNVLPGSFDTSRLSSLIEYQATQQGISFDQAKNKMTQTIPAGRIGNPKEFANVVAFLASPAASYVNGTAISVDGGRGKTI